MEYGAHLPLIDFGGGSASLASLREYARAVAPGAVAAAREHLAPVCATSVLSPAGAKPGHTMAGAKKARVSIGLSVGAGANEGGRYVVMASLGTVYGGEGGMYAAPAS